MTTHNQFVGEAYALDAGMAVQIKAGVAVEIESSATIALRAGASYILIGPETIEMSSFPIPLGPGVPPVPLDDTAAAAHAAARRRRRHAQGPQIGEPDDIDIALTCKAARARRRARIEIDDESATIGRAPDCTMVLTDGQRGISRIQARIEWRENAYVLVDAGSNPTLLNDRVLDGTHEAPLQEGDRLRIGAYTLVVSMRRGERARRPAASRSTKPS